MTRYDATHPSRSLEEHLQAPGPKRILCLDGGGVRGALTLAVLERVEALLRERHGGGREFRLSDYFDLIAGTSTGAIIAAALARGMPVAEVRDLYRGLAAEIFEKSLLRDGYVRAKYSATALTNILKKTFGEETTLGSRTLETGLLVVMKRADTGSPWPVSNNPKGRYFSPQKASTVPNKDYPLWAVVRASTAAPSYFDPERIVITASPGGPTVDGTFVDGGTSTANNPSLLALRYATASGYRLGWPMGEQQLLVVSVGTGRRPPGVLLSDIAARSAIQALVALMDDCNDEAETVMQWLGHSHTYREIDREVGTLERDTLGAVKLLTYQRYNVELSAKGLNTGLGLGLDGSQIANVAEMDAPENVALLEKIGKAIGKTQVKGDHFPSCFDVRPAPVGGAAA